MLTQSEPEEQLKNHAVVVHEGIIVDVLPSDQVTGKYVADEEFFLNDHVLMSGLVNTHGHAAMSLLRGYADDLELHRWLEDHIWPTEGKNVGHSFVYDGTRLAIAEMIRNGTTCFSDMYFFPEACIDAVRESGMRAQVAPNIFDFPSAWSTPEDYFDKVTAAREYAADDERITFAIAPHAPYTVNDENFTRCMEYVREHHLPLQVHLHETQKEADDAEVATGKRPIQRLLELGVITDKAQLVHMTAMTDREIAQVAKAGASVLHCPKSNLKLASGIAPVQKLLDAGVNVAIGTDGGASNNALDMFSELQYAAMVGKVCATDATAVSAAMVLRMATLNGAKALGLDHLIGSLVSGKQADFIAVRLDQIEQLPLFNPQSHLVYTQSSNNVTHTWVGGQCLMKDRKLTTMDEEKVKVAALKWQQAFMKPNLQAPECC